MKKYFFSLVAIVQITLLFIPVFVIEAGFLSPSTPDVGKEIRDFLENDLLIDDNELGIGQSVQKTLAPEVIINFTKLDETHYRATATPKGITNPEEAYYTWYIKNEKNKELRGFAPIGTLPLADQLGTQIGGGIENDPEFWKIMATREMIKYNFDPMRYDSTFNGGDGNFVLTEYPANTDDDGYEATVGGHNAQNGTKYCYIHNKKSGEIFEMMAGGDNNSGVVCPTGFSGVCLDNDRLACPDAANPANIKLFDSCEDKGDPICTPGFLGMARPLCPRGGLPFCILNTFTLTGGSCPMAGEANPKSCTDFVTDGTIVPSMSCSGDMIFGGNPRLVNPCNEDGIHLFPFPLNEAAFGITFVSGDGNFGLEEERFWGTDPENDNTLLDKLDEEVIVGKGMSTFIWEYHEGDEVGVVVEGTGDPTRHDDRSMQTVFAFMQGGCEPINTASYIENVRGKDIEIFTADMDRDDLNDCIDNDKNFSSPGGQREELDLDVEIIGPKNKIVPKDPTEFITFDSVLTHAGSDMDVPTERHNTNFEWFIEHSHSKTSGFTLVTDRTFLRDQFGILNSEGIGVDSFKMSQNFPDRPLPSGETSWFAEETDLSKDEIKDKGWVKVTLRANAPSARGDVSRFGQTSYLFQITNTSQTPPTISVARPEDATYSGYTKQLDICTGAQEHLNCPVLVNQVIKVALPSTAMTSENTLWKVNGKSVFCNEFISTECTPGSHSAIYIPITKDVDTYEITATLSELGTVAAHHVNIANEIASTTEFNAVLNKVTPELLLKARGSAKEFVRGDKKDLTGGSLQEVSHNLFTTLRGSGVIVEAEFIPGFLGGTNLGVESHLEWYINSAQQNLVDVDSVNFSSERDVRVKANGFYDISNEKRQTLQNVFGITADISGRTFFDETVKVEMVDNAALVGVAPSNKIFATISQNSPTYIMFLLKMIFMIGIILFIPSVILNLSKKSD